MKRSDANRLLFTAINFIDVITYNDTFTWRLVPPHIERHVGIKTLAITTCRYLSGTIFVFSDDFN